MTDFSPVNKKQPTSYKVKRLIIVGDLHFGVGANDEYFFRSMVAYHRQVLIPWLVDNIKLGDVILFTGDVFDNDTTLRIEVHDAVVSLFEKFATLAPVVVIVGNHDVVKKKSNEVNSLRGIGQIDNVFVYYKPTIWKCDYDKNILLYPWVKDIESVDVFLESKCNILVSHAHYNGLAFDNEFVKKENGEVKSIDVKDLGMFDIVINGHIHRKQDLLNIMNVGAPYQLTYNDRKNLCGFHTLDLETYEKVFYENTFSPRFHQDDIISLLDMTKRQAVDVTNNKLVRISYPAELAKTFSLDNVRKELDNAISVEFLPEYKYGNDHSSKLDDKVPEIVDLKNVLENVAHSLELPTGYADSLATELHEMYMQHTKIETAEI